jgi:alpha-ribazole phosphatase
MDYGDAKRVGREAPSQTRLYLARHAQPERHDEQRRFLGPSNIPLGPEGLAQARALAERLRQASFDAVFSSDLARCLRTAEIVADAAGRSVTTDARLREIDTGFWEGLTQQEAYRRYPKEFAEREDDVTGYPFPGGESFRQLQARVLPALEEIVVAGYSTVLLVAHLGVNRVMLAHLRGVPLAGIFSFSQDYCDFDVVDVPGVS